MKQTRNKLLATVSQCCNTFLLLQPQFKLRHMILGKTSLFDGRHYFINDRSGLLFGGRYYFVIDPVYYLGWPMMWFGRFDNDPQMLVIIAFN